MSSKRATIYLREHTVGLLGESGEGLSMRIGAMLSRFGSICQEIMPEFTRAEWCAIMDANNGGTDYDAADGMPSNAIIWANVHDCKGLGEKWGIDKKKLVKRLQLRTPAELIAIDEAISRFWNHPELETNAALEVAWCKVSEED